MRPPQRNPQPSGRGQENYRDKYRGPVRGGGGGGDRNYQQQQDSRNQRVLASSSDEEERIRISQQKAKKFNNLIDDQNRLINQATTSERYRKERSRSQNERYRGNYRGRQYQNRGYGGEDGDEVAEDAFDPEFHRAEMRLLRDKEREIENKDYTQMFSEEISKGQHRGRESDNRGRRNYYADPVSRPQNNQNQRLDDQSYSDYGNFEKGLPSANDSQFRDADGTLMLDETLQELEGQLAGTAGNQPRNQGAQGQRRGGGNPPTRTSPPPSIHNVFRGGAPDRQHYRREAPPQYRDEHERYEEDRYRGQGRYQNQDPRHRDEYFDEDEKSSDSEEARIRMAEKRDLMEQNRVSYNHLKHQEKRSNRGGRGDNHNLGKRRFRNPEDPEMDDRMRILTSMNDFVEPGKGSHKVYMPKANGIQATYMYNGRYILGSKAFLRGQPQDSEPTEAPRGEIIQFVSPNPQQVNPQSEEELRGYEQREKQMIEIHKNYYKNFEESKPSLTKISETS